MAPSSKKEPVQCSRPVPNGGIAGYNKELSHNDGVRALSLAPARRLAVLQFHLAPSKILITSGTSASRSTGGGGGGSGGGGEGNDVCNICYKPKQPGSTPPGQLSQWCSCPLGVSSAGKALGEHENINLEEALRSFEEESHWLNCERAREASLRRKLQQYQEMLSDPGLDKKARYEVQRQAATARTALNRCLVSISVAEEALAKARGKLQRAQLRAGN